MHRLLLVALALHCGCVSVPKAEHPLHQKAIEQLQGRLNLADKTLKDQQAELLEQRQELQRCKSRSTEREVELSEELDEKRTEVDRLRARLDEMAADPSQRLVQARAVDAELKARDTACRLNQKCGTLGLCGYDSRLQTCVPTRNEHCRQAKTCRVLGRCSLPAAEGVWVCVAASDADCRRSDVCRLEAQCVAEDGECR